jgi:hypothetical protein
MRKSDAECQERKPNGPEVQRDEAGGNSELFEPNFSTKKSENIGALGSQQLR